jgi:hypothetical protein
MTPEGRVKAAVDRAIEKLRERGHAIYKHKPVQNGMGAPTLDYTGSAWSFYFTIETKAPGAKPTPRQEKTIDDVQQAKGKVFVIDGAIGIVLFEEWVEECCRLFVLVEAWRKGLQV